MEKDIYEPLLLKILGIKKLSDVDIYHPKREIITAIARNPYPLFTHGKLNQNLRTLLIWKYLFPDQEKVKEFISKPDEEFIKDFPIYYAIAVQFADFINHRNPKGYKWKYGTGTMITSKRFKYLKGRDYLYKKGDFDIPPKMLKDERKCYEEYIRNHSKNLLRDERS